MARRPGALALGTLCAGLLILAASCGDGENELILGTTTSVQDTGLLDEIIQAFEGVTDYDVKPIVGGSGQTLETARRGEFDVILTHSPEDEDQFIADEEGLDKRVVMRNFFLIAGPPDDPAAVRDAPGISDAFQRIATGGHSFVSRGDSSGTHRREQSIWKELGVEPDDHSWYTVSSVGQGQNLLVASDKRAYTLTDSSTFTTFEARTGLEALLTDTEKPNPYSIIRINAAKHDGINAAAAIAFAEFLTSIAGQCLIEEFGVEEYGESLFQPTLNCPTSNVGG